MFRRASFLLGAVIFMGVPALGQTQQPSPNTAIQISTTTTNSPQYKLWIELEVD